MCYNIVSVLCFGLVSGCKACGISAPLLSIEPTPDATLEDKVPIAGLPAAAAAAKSLQSCPTLCDPIDGSPPGSPVPEGSPQTKFF